MAGNVILITGASRGIGLAVAQYLIRDSHRVFLVARTPDKLKLLKDQYADQVDYLVADLANVDIATKVAHLAVQSFGRLDGMVINHGMLSPIRRIADTHIKDWQEAFDVNFFSAVGLVQAAIPHLRSTKGRIIFTSSGAAVGGYQAWGAYGTSKAAINSLARHLAVEEPEIASVAISPGRTDTHMQTELRERGKDHMAEKDYQAFVSAFKEGKLNKPEGPGNVIARLSLHAKSDLSGQYLSWNAPELADYQDTR